MQALEYRQWMHSGTLTDIWHLKLSCGRMCGCTGIMNGGSECALAAGVNAMVSSQTTIKISQLQVCACFRPSCCPVLDEQLMCRVALNQTIPGVACTDGVLL